MTDGHASVDFGADIHFGELKWADDELRGPTFEARGVVDVPAGRQLVLNLSRSAAGHVSRIRPSSDDLFHTVRARGIGLIQPDLDAITTWVGLRKLIIDNQPDHALDLAPLRGRSELTYLALKETGVTDEQLPPIGELVSLERLHLTGNDVRVLAPLRTLEQLITLGLSGTCVGDEGVSVVASTPLLRALWLMRTQVTSAIVPLLARLSRLETLAAGSTGITDEGLDQLAGHPSLKRVDLSATAVTTDGVRRLCGAPNLRELYLDRTRLDDDVVDALAATNLTMVSLVDADVSDAALQRLRTLLPSVTINGVAPVCAPANPSS